MKPISLPKGVDYRADQQAFLSGMAHNRLVSVKVQELIEACESDQANLSTHEQINIREWRKDYDRSVKLPTEFVERFEKTCSLAKASWAEARRENKFDIFLQSPGANHRSIPPESGLLWLRANCLRCLDGTSMSRAVLQNP